MKFILNKNILNIENLEDLYSGSINYFEIDIEFDETWDDLTKEAIMIREPETDGERIAILDNTICLSKQLDGKYFIGFIGYTIENGEKIYQISTNLKQIMFFKGAGQVECKETEELPSPTQWEIYISQIQKVISEANNLDVDIENSIITITKKDGTIKTENVKGEKGEKGDAGSIKFIIVNELPTEDIDESAIYMKAVESEDAQNSYEEYIYVNGTWESLGIAQVEVDLTDYVKNTDYAGTTNAGTVRYNNSYGIRATTTGYLQTIAAAESEIDDKTSSYKPIVPKTLDYAVKSVVGGHVTLTQTEYDALETKDENTYYYIIEEE